MTKPEVTWQSLNKRQQDYLTAIYCADQEIEAYERGRWSRGERSRPAEEWRWMPYATSFPSRLPMTVKKHLSWTEQISEGTGSTLQALETRALILMQYLLVEELQRRGILSPWQGVLEAEPIPVIQITPAGRKLIRQALGVQMARHVAGTLQEWHWRALTLIYAAREGKGILQESGYYARIGWKTWLRLREYKPAPLIQHYREQLPDSPVMDSYLHITSFGVAFYERAYPRYRALYPSIDAPSPPTLPDLFEPYYEQGQGHETCRACRGKYLTSITFTYQQTRTFTWRVEEASTRIPGLVTVKYGEVEQCRCQEGEIEEMEVPFLPLLDQLLAQGWQMCFPHHHSMNYMWMNYLDYLVGGLSTDRAPRWYDTELVKEKVAPFVDAIALDDIRAIVKGIICYCWNERAGCGSIYPHGLSGELSAQPIARTRNRTR